MLNYEGDFLTAGRLRSEEERIETDQSKLRTPPLQEVRQWVTISLSLSLPPVTACLPPVRRQLQCWWCAEHCQPNNRKRWSISESHECRNYRHRHCHRRGRQLIVLSKNHDDTAWLATKFQFQFRLRYLNAFFSFLEFHHALLASTRLPPLSSVVSNAVRRRFVFNDFRRISISLMLDLRFHTQTRDLDAMLFACIARASGQRSKAVVYYDVAAVRCRTVYVRLFLYWHSECGCLRFDHCSAL